MAQLASDLGQFTTTIVMVYRPYYDWISSVYRQTSKSGIPFELWLTDEIIESKTTPFPSFTTSAYKRYAAIFSDVRVHMLGPSLMTEIVCDDLHASKTCDHFQASTLEPYNVKANFTVRGRGCLSSHQLQKLETMSINLHREAFGIFSSFPKSDFDIKALSCFGNP